MSGVFVQLKMSRRRRRLATICVRVYLVDYGKLVRNNFYVLSPATRFDFLLFHVKSSIKTRSIRHGLPRSIDSSARSLQRVEQTKNVIFARLLLHFKAYSSDTRIFFGRIISFVVFETTKFVINSRHMKQNRCD